MNNAFNVALAFVAPLTFLIAALVLASPVARAHAESDRISTQVVFPHQSAAEAPHLRGALRTP